MSLWESKEIDLASELLSVEPDRTETRSSGLAHWQSAGLSRRPAVLPFPSMELTQGHGWRLLRSRRFHRDENTLLGQRVRGAAFEEACSGSVDRGGSFSAHESTANSTSNRLAHLCLSVINFGAVISSSTVGCAQGALRGFPGGSHGQAIMCGFKAKNCDSARKADGLVLRQDRLPPGVFISCRLPANRRLKDRAPRSRF